MKNWSTLEADKNRILTKHFTPGRSGQVIEFVVVHHNGGRLTTDGCWEVWQDREASAHYQVEADGTIGQLVWDRDTAWHAANLTANRKSIGVEHANSSSSTSPITDATLDAGAHLVAALCVKYQLGRPAWKRNVFPHQHFTSTDCPGHIAGDQNAAYMARAGYWYDQMTSKAGPSVAAASSPKPNPARPWEGLGRPISFRVYQAGLADPRGGGNVRIVQQLLAAQGAQYMPAPIDGKDSPAMRQGITAYQKAIGDTGAAADGRLGPKQFGKLVRWGGWKDVA